MLMHRTSFWRDVNSRPRAEKLVVRGLVDHHHPARRLGVPDLPPPLPQPAHDLDVLLARRVEDAGGAQDGPWADGHPVVVGGGPATSLHPPSRGGRGPPCPRFAISAQIGFPVVLRPSFPDFK